MDVKDDVYGIIEIPSDIASIIRTEQFQRLKNISQLGLYLAVLTRGKHTRYDHCIGTYYQTRQMLDALEKNSESFPCTEKWKKIYRKSVEIAALLHDVGHGPLSHAWETISKNYHHEENAIPCIEAIFHTLDVNILHELRADNNYGIELIKALILGDPKRLPRNVPDEYRFIFEIVNNKQCNVDIDKLDYLKRDHHYLNEYCDPNMDLDDIFYKARISTDGAHIEYRYRDFEKIYLLFVARSEFHLNCYRSPKNNYGDYLLQQHVAMCDATIFGKSLTEITARDMDAFLQFTDDKVLQLIGLGKDVIRNIKELNIIECCEQDEKMICIRDQITSAGKEMPPDEMFHLYGDKNDKKQIYRDLEPKETIGYFSR